MTLKRPCSIYTEEDIADTLFDITDSSLLQNYAAPKYSIPQQSISDRLYRQTAIADQTQPHQCLNKNQEAKLVSWILHQESLGYTPSYSQIRTCITAFIKQQNIKQKLGCNWVKRFIKCYSELKTKPGRYQEANRFNLFTPKAVYWYFDIRKGEYNWIKPENTVNIDKSSIISGFGKYLACYL
jgi:hypothetical protein